VVDIVVFYHIVPEIDFFLILNVVLVVVNVAICVPVMYPNLFFVVIGQLIKSGPCFTHISNFP